MSSASAWRTPPIRNTDWFDEPDACAWSDLKREVPHVKRLLIIDEFVGRVLASSATQTVEVSDELEQSFIALAKKWQDETGSLSSVTKRVMHPSYQAIVGMGRDVVPILLRDLEMTGRDWFWALTAITQENPIAREDAGRVDKMTSAWVAWGRRKRLI
ncbi:MAG TPA: hypothetical protein VJN69_07790 [Candidatus Acidoferrales bacterium]|nr:hypothetical protein [Candidatus Acidoferrales bacterium]